MEVPFDSGTTVGVPPLVRGGVVVVDTPVLATGTPLPQAIGPLPTGTRVAFATQHLRGRSWLVRTYLVQQQPRTHSGAGAVPVVVALGAHRNLARSVRQRRLGLVERGAVHVSGPAPSCSPARSLAPTRAFADALQVACQPLGIASFDALTLREAMGFRALLVADSEASPRFGVVRIGGRSVVRAWTVRNAGTVSARGLQVRVVGRAASSFPVDWSTCRATLRAGATCLVGVRFAPRSAGVVAAELRIEATGASRAAVELRGTGDRPDDAPGGADAIVAETTAPSAPTLDAAGIVVGADASVTVTWAATATGGAATTYELLRRAASGGETAQVATTATTSAVDRTASACGSYVYSVRASNEAGLSAPSAERAVVVDATTPRVTAMRLAGTSGSRPTVDVVRPGGGFAIDVAIADACTDQGGTAATVDVDLSMLGLGTQRATADDHDVDATHYTHAVRLLAAPPTLTDGTAASWSVHVVSGAGHSVTASWLVQVDAAGPAPAALVASTPPGTGSTTRPTLTLSAADPSTESVLVYADGACAGPAIPARVEADALQAQVEVPRNVRSTLATRSLDAVGNSSPCTALTTYVHDDTPPAAPSASYVPGDAALGLLPRVAIAGGEPDIAVAVFSDARCRHIQSIGHLDMAGAAQLEIGPTLDPAVLFVLEQDSAGNVSACTPVTVV